MSVFNCFPSRHLLVIGLFSLMVISCRKDLKPFLVEASEEDVSANGWQPINNIDDIILTIETNQSNNVLYYVTFNSSQTASNIYTFSFPTSTFKKSISQKIDILKPGTNENYMVFGRTNTNDALYTYYYPTNSFYSTQFTIYNFATGRIRDIVTASNRYFFCGTFMTSNSNALSDYVQNSSPFVSGQAFGMPGIESPGNTIDYINDEILIGGQDLNAAGDDVLAWDGTAWNQTSFFQSDPAAIVTDMVFYKDTFFTCGKMISTGQCIQKNKNGQTIYCQDLETFGGPPNVKFISYNNELYIYGTIRRPSNNPVENGLFKYQNGLWKQIGNNLSNITDVAFFNGYVYAISDGKMYRKVL